MKALLPVALFAAIAGCQGIPTQEAPPHDSNPFSNHSIEAGTWQLFYPLTEPEEELAIQGTRQFAYPDPGVHTSDAYECATALSANEWLRHTESFKSFTGPDVARAEGSSRLWVDTELATFGGKSEYTLFGTYHSPDDGAFAFAQDTYGGTSSHWNITPETSFALGPTGRYWCLNGLARFEGGNYFATNQMVSASGNTWQQQFDHGIVARLEATVDNLEIAVKGPDASAVVTVTDTVDLTFCSHQPGNYQLTIAKMTSDRPWQLIISILDMDLARMECAETWRPSQMSPGNP